MPQHPIRWNAILAHLGYGFCLVASTVFASPGQTEAYAPPPRQVQTNTQLLAGGYAAAMALYGYNAWWQDNSGQFKIEGEGWFGEDSYRGGADKLGHLYTTYVSTRLLSQAFHALGNDRPKSRRLAGLLVGTTTFAIEVLDGYTEDIGFSWEDLVMDAAGIGFGLLLDHRPDLDRKFDFRLHYRPSSTAQRLGEHDPASDYSGQTYLFITKLNGVLTLQKRNPLRYVELAIGYGSRGYWPTDGSEPKKRHLFYGVSLNLSQLLDDTVFRHGQASRIRSVTRGTLEYLQPPGTTALADWTL